MTATELPIKVTTTGAARETTAPDPRRWKALGVLALIQFMLILDVTVVNVALPHIKGDLGFSRSGLTWVVDAYVLMAGGLLLLGGRLADLLGRRRMFIVGITLFAVASALSGAALNPGMLVASRFAQGAAEAMAAPAAFGLCALLFPDARERAKALGIFGGMAGLGGTLGPVISGLILSGLSWRWIFFVNIPVAVIAVVAVLRLVEESRADTMVGAARQRPDIAGAILATGGMISVVFGLVNAADHPWGSRSVVAALVAGAALLFAFVARERTTDHPLIPLRFFSDRTRVTTNVATLFFTTVFFSLFFLLTLYWEQVQHYSALRTGVAYLPFGMAIGLGIAISTKLVTRFGVRPLLAGGFAISTLGMLAISRISVHGSYVHQALPGLVVMAFGAGLCFSGFVNASVHNVSRADASLASGVQNAVQQVGGAIGLAVLVTLALRHAATATAHGIAAAAAATDGYVVAFRIGAVILAMGAVVVLVFMERGAGAGCETSSRPEATEVHT